MATPTHHFISKIPIDKLMLDFNNPRFGELYMGSKDENELITYLLNNEAADEIANSIVNNGE